jgi:hypothetical protein
MGDEFASAYSSTAAGTGYSKINVLAPCRLACKNVPAFKPVQPKM